LLDISGAHLRTLAALLAEQLDESVAGSDDTLEVRGEVANVWRLWKAGIVKENYARADVNGVVNRVRMP
jgi:hypothetical protein